MDNPRFPHTCTVYRMEKETEFSEGTKAVLYEGECRKWKNGNAKGEKALVVSDYALSVPRSRKLGDGTEVRIIPQVRAGDIVEAEDMTGNYKGRVIDCHVGNLGTTIYWDNDKN